MFKERSKMRTKTDKAIGLFKDGKLRDALAIFKTFKIGFTKDERRTIQIASETLNGSGQFYQMLGIDTALEVQKSITVIKQKYMKVL